MLRFTCAILCVVFISHNGTTTTCVKPFKIFCTHFGYMKPQSVNLSSFIIDFPLPTTSTRCWFVARSHCYSKFVHIFWSQTVFKYIKRFQCKDNSVTFDKMIKSFLYCVYGMLMLFIKYERSWDSNTRVFTLLNIWHFTRPLWCFVIKQNSLIGIFAW